MAHTMAVLLGSSRGMATQHPLILVKWLEGWTHGCLWHCDWCVRISAFEPPMSSYAEFTLFGQSSNHLTAPMKRFSTWSIHQRMILYLLSYQEEWLTNSADSHGKTNRFQVIDESNGQNPYKSMVSCGNNYQFYTVFPGDHNQVWTFLTKRAIPQVVGGLEHEFYFPILLGF